MAPRLFWCCILAGIKRYRFRLSRTLVSSWVPEKKSEMHMKFRRPIPRASLNEFNALDSSQLTKKKQSNDIPL